MFRPGHFSSQCPSAWSLGLYVVVKIKNKNKVRKSEIVFKKQVSKQALVRKLINPNVTKENRGKRSINFMIVDLFFDQNLKKIHTKIILFSDYRAIKDDFFSFIWVLKFVGILIVDRSNAFDIWIDRSFFSDP